MKDILLGQLGANGDCLYATILARQIRNDFPDAKITWAISSQCRHLLANNPHVDDIWEIAIPAWDQHEVYWRVFEREALRQYGRRNFDHVILSQIWPSNFQNFDGTVRSSILRSYGKPITVPIENIICLTDQERARVQQFVLTERIMLEEHRILFECSSKSGQSFVTPDKAQDIADALYRLLPNATVIFSTHLPMTLRDKRSRYAGSLTLREVADLTHHISLFVGAGSGGTVAASSSAAKIVPMVQLLSKSTSVFASFAHDFSYFGLTERQVLEITSEEPAFIAQCLAAVCNGGIETARDEFDGRIPVTFDYFLSLIETCLLAQHRYLDAARSLSITAERYGWGPELVAFARQRVIPNLALDQAWLFERNRKAADTFLADVSRAGNGSFFPSQRLWSEGSALMRSP